MNELDGLGFEAAAKANGEVYWSARWFAGILGYADYKSFQRVINRAIKACASGDIPAIENFRQTTAEVNGRTVDDIKLSRFACYLVAMNGDPKKDEVGKAQVYFASLAEALTEYVEAAQQVDRLVIRGDLADEERILASTAKSHQVEQYAFFHNAGYRGMYNMNLSDLRVLKGVPLGKSPLDYMHSTELAANLFRITQTTAKINHEGIVGQTGLEKAATDVGRTVRRTMIELSGTPPEALPAADDIKKVRSNLKETQKTLRKLDALPPPKN